MNRTERIVAYIGSIGTVLAVIATMVWGVPYYIDRKVEDRVNEIQAGDTPLNEAEPIVRLNTTVESMVSSQEQFRTDVNARFDRLNNNLETLRDLYIQDLERRSQ